MTTTDVHTILSTFLGIHRRSRGSAARRRMVSAHRRRRRRRVSASPEPIRWGRTRSRRTACRKESSMVRSSSRARSSPARCAATGSTCRPQYTASTPANVLVFQDGQRATNPTGSLRVPQVLENLIHKKDIPVTIGIFITPGQRGDAYPEDLGTGNPNNRAAEYDSLSDAYARFIVDEMLPEVGKTYNLTKDPAGRAIGGTSSGAICAFTVAWHRPDQFKNVISMIGSYTSIGYRPAQDGQPMTPGGDLYPTLIRKNPIKPIKIFLQDGSADLDNAARQLVPRQSADAGRAQLRQHRRRCEEAARPALRDQARVGRRGAFRCAWGITVAGHSSVDVVMTVGSRQSCSRRVAVVSRPQPLGQPGTAYVTDAGSLLVVILVMTVVLPAQAQKGAAAAADRCRRRCHHAVGDARGHAAV